MKLKTKINRNVRQMKSGKGEKKSANEGKGQDHLHGSAAKSNL